MSIFRTLGSGSLSVTAMLDFSGKANTSIHGIGEDDTARWGSGACHTRSLQTYSSCLGATGMFACTSRKLRGFLVVMKSLNLCQFSSFLTSKVINLDKIAK